MSTSREGGDATFPIRRVRKTVIVLSRVCRDGHGIGATVTVSRNSASERHRTVLWSHGCRGGDSDFSLALS